MAIPKRQLVDGIGAFYRNDGVLSIRAHKSPLHSKPTRALLTATIAIVVITLLLPYTPLADLLGFQALPIEFLLVLAALVGLSILCAETVKRVFYQHVQI